MADLVLVKPPNKRGDGVSNMFTSHDSRWTSETVSMVYVKRQKNYYCRPIWNFFRRTPMVAREYRALVALKKSELNLPNVVDYRRDGNEAMLVTAAIADTQPLDIALQVEESVQLEIARAVGTAIGQLHGAGWTHGALYPYHLLVQRDPELRVFIIDFEKASRSRRFQRDIDRLFRYLQIDPPIKAKLLAAYRAEKF